MSYVTLTFWFVAQVLVAYVLPAKMVPVVAALVLNSPMFLSDIVVDTNELLLAKVAVNRARLLLELVAVVTDARELV